ncbi:hypothetical protein BN135_2612 [Cronobacter muytjensii 530]
MRACRPRQRAAQNNGPLKFSGYAKSVFYDSKIKSLLLLKKSVAKVTDYFGRSNKKTASRSKDCADQNE